MQKNGLYWITGIAIVLCMACAAVQAADINYELVTIKRNDGMETLCPREEQSRSRGRLRKSVLQRGCWLVVNDGTG